MAKCLHTLYKCKCVYVLSKLVITIPLCNIKGLTRCVNMSKIVPIHFYNKTSHYMTNIQLHFKGVSHTAPKLQRDPLNKPQNNNNIKE